MAPAAAANANLERLALRADDSLREHRWLRDLDCNSATFAYNLKA